MAATRPIVHEPLTRDEAEDAITLAIYSNPRIKPAPVQVRRGRGPRGVQTAAISGSKVGGARIRGGHFSPKGTPTGGKFR